MKVWAIGDVHGHARKARFGGEEEPTDATR